MRPFSGAGNGTRTCDHYDSNGKKIGQSHKGWFGEKGSSFNDDWE